MKHEAWDTKREVFSHGRYLALQLRRNKDE